MKSPSRDAQLRVLKVLAPLSREICGGLGFLMVGHGAALIWAPLGWIVYGLGLMAVAVLLARKS